MLNAASQTWGTNQGLTSAAETLPVRPKNTYPCLTLTPETSPARLVYIPGPDPGFIHLSDGCCSPSLCLTPAFPSSQGTQAHPPELLTHRLKTQLQSSPDHGFSALTCQTRLALSIFSSNVLTGLV